MDDNGLKELARQLGKVLSVKGLKLALAESCTGGWVAKVVTDVGGSSAWFERGFVTYTNNAKQQMLGVDEEPLQTYGAVSEQTVEAMAQGAIQYSDADVSLAISGIAGPDGGTAEKPVGLVYFAWLGRGMAPRIDKIVFTGNREVVRRQAVAHGLKGLLEYLDGRG